MVNINNLKNKVGTDWEHQKTKPSLKTKNSGQNI